MKWQMKRSPRRRLTLFLKGTLAIACLGLTLNCETIGGDRPNQELLEEFYEAQLQTLKALDQAFYQIGQEYFTLDIEYQGLGRDALAEVSRRKADRFHQQHLRYQATIAEMEEKQARVQRGESPNLPEPEGEGAASEAPSSPAP